MDLSSHKEEDIVIVGGGICGLATALALHRKGIKSVVLERSESLQYPGAGIAIYANGCRALDQMGVGTKLRSKAIPLQMWREIRIDKGTTTERPVGKGEFRCLRRRDLIEIMAEALPAGIIHFSQRVVGVQMDTLTSYSTLHLDDGSTITSKVVIGCDGVNSIVAHSLNLNPPKLSHIGTLRCLTNYPDEHNYGDAAIRVMKNRLHLGVLPIDKNQVFWFISWPQPPGDSGVIRDPKLLREAALDQMKDFPPEVIELVKNGDPESIIYTRVKYRAPWDLLFPSFREGAITVAGDAMHVMGPFVGQGGASAMEDAVVLARCLAQEMRVGNGSSRQLQTNIGMALDNYVKERRGRILRLSIQTYLRQLLQTPVPLVVKLVVFAITAVLFGKSQNDTQYDWPAMKLLCYCFVLLLNIFFFFLLGEIPCMPFILENPKFVLSSS